MSEITPEIVKEQIEFINLTPEYPDLSIRYKTVVLKYPDIRYNNDFKKAYESMLNKLVPKISGSCYYCENKIITHFSECANIKKNDKKKIIGKGKKNNEKGKR